MRKFVYFRSLWLFFLFGIQTLLLSAQTRVKQGPKYDTIIRKHITKSFGKPVTKPEMVLPVPEFMVCVGKEYGP